MKKEYKELLLKDLCARLPYGVKCKISLYKTAFNVLGIVEDKVKIDSPVYDEGDDWWEVTEVKPYLRSMKDMTEDEAKEMFTVLYPKFDLTKVEIVEDRVRYYAIGNGWTAIFFNRIYATEQMDWLLEKHFDFRGLIDLDLAIRVTEENNPYKN